MNKEGDIRIFEGKGLFSSIRIELKLVASMKSSMILSYYKNGKLVKRFPVSGTSIKRKGKTLDLKYSGEAFGGPAFMSVNCKLLKDHQLEEMMREIRDC